MSQSTMSMSSSSRATPSADESGYVTVIPRRNPPASVEEDPSEDTEDTGDSSGSSSDHASSQHHGTSPTPAMPQPPLYGLHFRRTARKSVPTPGRMALGGAGPSTVGPSAARPSEAGPSRAGPSIARPSAPGPDMRGPSAPPPRQVIGIPVRQTGMTPGELRSIRWMAADVRHGRTVMAGHQQILDELISGMDILYQRVAEATDAARAAKEVADCLMFTCGVVGGLLLVLIMMFLVGMVIRVWF